jgi:hypothetical protein
MTMESEKAIQIAIKLRIEIGGGGFSVEVGYGGKVLRRSFYLLPLQDPYLQSKLRQIR